MKLRDFSKIYGAIGTTILGILISATTTFATEYHVTTSGNDTTGNGSTGNPWGTPYAAEKLTGGDILYIHAGTYSVNGGFSSGVHVVSGTTITNYPGDRPFLDTGSSPTGPTFVISNKINVTISGLKIRGQIWVAEASSNITIENNEMYGGGQLADDFGCLFYTVGSTPNHSDITIRNNYFHDNYQGGSSGNSPLLQLYDTDGIVIEYNTFENAAHAAINLKDDQNDAVIRYNFFLNSGDGDIRGGNQDQGYNVDIYNNIMVGSRATFRFGSIATEFYLNNWNIYNNTIVRPNIGIGAITDSQNINIWNNIVYGPKDYFIAGRTELRYVDYNQYYDAGNSADYYYGTSNYSTLSAWQNATSFDGNSLTANPNFINSLGSTPEDFKRTSYPNDGRGGSYNSVIGAWLSDGSPAQIGANIYSPPPSQGGEPISTPKGFSIIN